MPFVSYSLAHRVIIHNVRHHSCYGAVRAEALGASARTALTDAELPQTRLAFASTLLTLSRVLTQVLPQVVVPTERRSAKTALEQDRRNLRRTRTGRVPLHCTADQILRHVEDLLVTLQC